MSDLDPHRSGTSNDLPPELWIGKVDHEWPLRAFASPAMAKAWLLEPATSYHKNKRLWHLTKVTGVEMTLTPPVEQQLVEKGDQ